MAGKHPTPNPLVTTGRGPDTSPNVQLHPLVLLTISDYITRHTVRQQKGPVVGAVIGQQNGRDITLEQAFQCKLADQGGQDSTLDSEWFLERLSMFKEVHKDPALDLVALFMLGPAAGPQPQHLPVLEQVQNLTSLDSTMLLLFHPEQVDALQGGKLPVSLYERFEETEGDAAQVRFRELAFEVETSDAEMISVDFVAKGAANATAIAKADPTETPGTSKGTERKSKGKGKVKERDSEEGAALATGPVDALSAADEELISSLTAKANAIKMLHQRLHLIRGYLTSLPASYLTDAASQQVPDDTTNLPLLRSISALLSRLPLLAPPIAASASPGDGAATSPLRQAGEREKQDVHLTALLASVTRTIAEAQDMGTKLGIVQREKTSRDRASRSAGGRMGNVMGRGVAGGDDGLAHEAGNF